MDAERFESMLRAAGTIPSRRGLIRFLAATAFVPLLGRPAPAVAGNCRRARRKCRRDKQCCGRCQRSGRCRATRPGTCKPGQDSCSGVLVSCNDQPDCFCFKTVGGGTFCGASEGGCIPCAENADCFAQFGKNAACIDLAGGSCPCGGLICAARCKVA